MTTRARATPARTKLLVSVRDADEARWAVEAGVDLIDVKEPTAGPLGPATPQALAEIAAAVGGARPLSAALGELDAFDPARAAALAGFQFAKLGLAGCAGRCDWPGLWQQALEQLPPGVAGVAVVYADHPQACAPAARPILTHGARLGCRAILIDTFDKQSAGLVDLWSLDEIGWLVDAAHGAGLLAVLAGRLTGAAIERLLPLAPDYVAVRSAVCQSDRGGRIAPDRMRALVALVGSGG